jgi:hypothetical protein
VTTFTAGQRLTASLLNALATPGDWQEATLINSWEGGGAGDVNGLYYRLNTSGDVDIIGDIINASATGNSVCAVLAAGYIPSVSQNLPAQWNDPQSSNSPTPPWVNVLTSGDIQISGIEVADKEIFFSFTVRMGPI